MSNKPQRLDPPYRENWLLDAVEISLAAAHVVAGAVKLRLDLASE